MKKKNERQDVEFFLPRFKLEFSIISNYVNNFIQNHSLQIKKKIPQKP